MIREYRGVIIWPRNYAGMYSARVDTDYARGGINLAADTLAGMRELIRETLA